eukprot:TRINITY_DN35708_c0_g1_i1.p1 TRINITY_DN35708_c0_g1~~TRINITY_DN35708_c0_g1_i1.p1  ORF type:complete len:316 (-),score=28.93 TRINITY_DN35708_c0_g1_i1:32-979(-)
MSSLSALAETDAEDHSEYFILKADVNLQNLIGTGCTAEVYRGLWWGQEVAVKQVRPTRTGFETIDGMVAIKRELSALIKLTKVEHANLVKLFGVCEPDSTSEELWIITELCKGCTCFELLHQRCEEIDLTFTQQLKMIADVAMALNYLHNFSPKIIHRDLKSLNLLLADEVQSPSDVPHVKVCDFGVAKLEESGGWGKMTLQAGTKHWMAPEMWVSSDYDEKVDVYSFSMVIFEIICLEVPFEDEEPNDVQTIVLRGGRPDMEAIPVTCPQPIVELMVHCWKQQPTERPDFNHIIERLIPVLSEHGMESVLTFLI